MLHVSRPRPRLDEFGRALIAERVLAPGNANNLTGSSSRDSSKGTSPASSQKGKHISAKNIGYSLSCSPMPATVSS